MFLTVLLVTGVGAKHSPSQSLLAAEFSGVRQLEQRAKDAYQSGNYKEAEQLWKQVGDIWKQTGDSAKMVESRLYQVRSQRSIGLYRRASQLLVELNEFLRKEPDSRLKAASLRELGNTLRLVGNLGNLKYLDDSCQPSSQPAEISESLEAGRILGESLAIAQRLGDSQGIGEALFSLGSTARALFERESVVGEVKVAQEEADKAVACYQRAASESNSSATRVRSQLNSLSLWVEIEDWVRQIDNQFYLEKWLPKIKSQILSSIADWRAIESEIDRVLPKQMAIYAKLDLAESLMNLNQQIPDNSLGASWQDIARLNAIAVNQAREVKNPRAESYALGNLGLLYERAGQFSNAQKVTQAALNLAKKINAPEIAYQWEWQLGRLFNNKQQKDIKKAIAYYTEAFYTLQDLRKDLVALNSDVQFNFRDRVQPVYRELVDLLLSQNPSQSELKLARDVIDGLQIAEIENFFRQSCLDAKQQSIDNLDATAAVIYPIILEDRLEVILSLPKQALSHYTTPMPQKKIKKIIEDMRENLTSESGSYLTLSKQMYEMLIKPDMSAKLKTAQIKTLVFVLDGELRNIPMAALYDESRKQYLVEEYPVALAPSLQLVAPNSLAREQLSALMAGATNAPSFEKAGLDALPNVEEELKQSKQQFSQSQLFYDGEFIIKNIEDGMGKNSPNVVHLATHGKFSSNLEQTYILDWDDRIDVNQLKDLLQNPNRNDLLELLVLSACETAKGVGLTH